MIDSEVIFCVADDNDVITGFIAFLNLAHVFLFTFSWFMNYELFSSCLALFLTSPLVSHPGLSLKGAQGAKPPS